MKTLNLLTQKHITAKSVMKKFISVLLTDQECSGKSEEDNE